MYGTGWGDAVACDSADWACHNGVSRPERQQEHELKCFAIRSSGKVRGRGTAHYVRTMSKYLSSRFGDDLLAEELNEGFCRLTSILRAPRTQWKSSSTRRTQSAGGTGRGQQHRRNPEC